MNDPEWLLDCQPREVQLEALRRSFGGFRTKDHKDELPLVEQIHKGRARGYGHFLEMRLGKTPLALNEMALFQREGVKRVLVFSPNSYKEDWVREATKFGIDIPFYAYETSYAERASAFVAQAKGLCGLVVNYEALQYVKTQRILDDFVDKDTMVIADESISLKNYQSITTKIATSVVKPAGVIRLLSGLPMTQGAQDLYPQLRMIGMFDGLNFFAYRNRYCKMGGFKGKKIVGLQNEEELHDQMALHSFTAKRIHWGNPTVPEYYATPLAMSPVQKRYYDEMSREFVTVLESGHEITADAVITQMLKLQQISSGFVYDEHKKPIYFGDIRKTPKMERLREMLQNEASGKVIVVFHYKPSGDALIDVLQDFNPAVIRAMDWHRSTGTDPQGEKARFNGDPNCRVMILNKAAKYGHDLSGPPGDRCATTLFYENSYSLDDRNQLEMRNTAASQDWTNVYIDYISSPVEAAAVKALTSKMSVAEAVLGHYGYSRERKQL